MSEPGPQFTRVWRGLRPANEGDYDAFDRCKKNHKEDEHTVDCLTNRSVETINFDSLGTHWTHDPWVARVHAGSTGTVLEGFVNKRHIMDMDTDEGKSYKKTHGILDYDNPKGVYKGEDYVPEKEITINPGSPIHIFSATFKTGHSKKESRLESFKTPIGGLT